MGLILVLIRQSIRLVFQVDAEEGWLGDLVFVARYGLSSDRLVCEAMRAGSQAPVGFG